MSVMLTATKDALRRKSAKALLKKKKPKPRAVDGPHVSAQNVKLWEWIMDDQSITLTFRKDTLEIWVNEDKAEVMNSFSADTDGAILDFLCCSQKARIETCRNDLGELDHILTINGIKINDSD